MARKEYVGNAPRTKLAASIQASDLSFQVDDGTNYPTGDTGKFVVTIDRGLAAEEKILCDSRSGNLFSINPDGRGFDGTAASAHPVEAAVEHTIDANTLNDIAAHIYDPSRNDHTQYAADEHTHAAGDVTSGQFPVARGGTGRSSVTVANFLRGAGSNPLEERTPAQVLADIGAAALGHLHAAADITSGFFSVARGGTGRSSLTASRYLRGNGTGAVIEDTYDTVRTNIGAAPTIHNHAAGDLTSGAVAVGRGGTGATSASGARNNLGAAAVGHEHIRTNLPEGVVYSNTGTYTGNGLSNRAIWVDFDTGESPSWSPTPRFVSIVRTSGSGDQGAMLLPGASIVFTGSSTVLRVGALPELINGGFRVGSSYMNTSGVDYRWVAYR